MDDGFVLIYRRLVEDPDFRNAGEAMAFAFLIMKASWRPTRVRYKDRIIALERGQLAMSVRDFAKHMDRGKTWAERVLGLLKNQDRIKTETKTGVNVITICNYSQYQINPETGKTPMFSVPRQEQDTEQRIERKKEKKEDNPPTPFAPPAWVPIEAWNGWMDVRKRMKVPNTERALAMAVGKLDELRRQGFDPAKILDEAALRGWRGIFAPNGQRGDEMKKQGALTL